MTDFDLERRICLLEFSKDLTSDQFKDLKFILKAYIPQWRSEAMTDAHELFEALDESLLLTPERLKRAFGAIKRADLCEKVSENLHLLARPKPPLIQPNLHNGHDDLVCDGAEAEFSSKVRKAKVKEPELFTSPDKSNNFPSSDKDEDPEHMIAVDKSQPPGLSVGLDDSTPINTDTHVEAHHPAAAESIPAPQLGSGLPVDVVPDVGDEDPAAVPAKGASVPTESNSSEGISSSKDSGYEASGARPKDTNPISKLSNKTAPSEQTDHGGTTNVSGALCSDESSQNNKAPSAPEKMPPAEGAFAAVGSCGKTPMEGIMDLGQQSSVHGSMHPHTEHKKTTSYTYTETHAVSGYQGLPGCFPTGPPHPTPPGAACSGFEQHMGQQQPLMYYAKDGYRIMIPQGQHYDSPEGDEGLVLMKDGETFWMEIQNETDCACEVEITFGGRFLGVWLLENGATNKENTIKVAGSSWESGALTFFNDAGPVISQLNPNEPPIDINGTIECVFVPEAIKLVVETMNSNEKHEVSIGRKAKVGDLINRIIKTCHIQEITCLLHGQRELNREKTLAEYCDRGKMKFGDTIRVLTSSECLEIQHQGQLIYKQVNPHRNCVKDVVQFLEEQLKCQSGRVRLRHKGKYLKPDEKLKALFLDGKPELELEMAETIEVMIRQPGKDQESLTTHTFATVESLKKRMQEEGVMSSAGAQLLFNKAILEDAKKCLAEYDIGNGSAIDIQPTSNARSTRSFGSGTRSFNMPSLSGSGSRGLDRLFGGKHSEGPALSADCSSGTRGWHSPGNHVEGFLGLMGNQKRCSDWDKDYSRKFEKELAVTLTLRLVSSAIQAPARATGPQRTKVPPPVPD